MPAQVSAATRLVTACVRKRQRKPGVGGPLWWLLRPASDGGPGTPAIVDVIRFSDSGQARYYSDAGPAVF